MYFAPQPRLRHLEPSGISRLGSSSEDSSGGLGLGVGRSGRSCCGIRGTVTGVGCIWILWDASDESATLVESEDSIGLVG